MLWLVINTINHRRPRETMTLMIVTVPLCNRLLNQFVPNVHSNFNCPLDILIEPVNWAESRRPPVENGIHMDSQKSSVPAGRSFRLTDSLMSMILISTFPHASSFHCWATPLKPALVLDASLQLRQDTAGKNTAVYRPVNVFFSLMWTKHPNYTLLHTTHLCLKIVLSITIHFLTSIFLTFFFY